MPTILLIRHGESESDAGMPTLSPEEVALTDLGIDQAQNIAHYLAYQILPNLIVTSSYQCAKQTAVPTKLRFLSVPEEVWPVHEFTYLSREEMRVLSTRRQRRPLVDIYWELCDPELVDGPGSESFEQFIERVQGVVKQFEWLEEQTVAVFSHEQFICAVYWLLERKPQLITSETMREFKDFLMEHSIPNGGFLRLQRSDARYPWQCELLMPLMAFPEVLEKAESGNKKQPEPVQKKATPGTHLKTFREQRAWSQSDLAERLRTTQVNISRWEHDITVPSPYYRQKLAELFGKSVAEFGFDTQSQDVSIAIPQPQTPLLWNLPFRRNPFFIGREEVLSHVHDIFHADKSRNLPQILAICGMGGIGKTQIAVEYAYRYRDLYSTVLWIKASSHDILISECTALSTILDLPKQNEQDQGKVILAIRRWLSSHTGWLLILDDIEDFNAISEIVPALIGGNILLTTRMRLIEPVAYTIEVGEMSIEEGAFFLLNRDGLPPHNTLLSGVNQEQLAEAGEIVAQLGGIPLALNQAGAYIKETRCDLNRYLELFRSNRRDLLRSRGNRPTDHPDSFSSICLLSFARIEQINAAAAELLRLLAFLHPDTIPEELITESGEELGPILAPRALGVLEFDAVLAILLRYMFVRRSSDTRSLSINRLVQAVLQDEMDKSLQSVWAERTIRAINRAFPVVDITTWEQCRRYLPHAQLSAAYIQEYGLLFPEAASLLNKTANYLSALARYSEAELLLQQALEIRQKIFDLEHPDTVQTINSLKELQNILGQQEQVPTYRWYLRLDGHAVSNLQIGQRITLTLHLSADEQPGSKALRIPTGALELAVYIEAPGFHLLGEHVRALPVVEGRPTTRSISLILIPVSSGKQTVRLLVYPGGRVDGLDPGIVSCDIPVSPLLALPDIPEMLDRRAIPEPQPNVILYVSLDEIRGAQQVQFHLTCQPLGFEREPLEPLPLTQFDLEWMRQAALEAVANVADAAPGDILTSLHAFGACLFDQLMPRSHPLRTLYGRIVQLANRSSTPWSWLVVSDERAILPWELVNPYRQQGSEMWYGQFLADQFVLAHWIGRQGLSLQAEAPVGWLALDHYHQHSEDLPLWHIALEDELSEKDGNPAGSLALMRAGSPYYGLHVLRFANSENDSRITYKEELRSVAQPPENEIEAMLYHRRLDFTLRRPVIGLSLVDAYPSGLNRGQHDTHLEEGWALPFLHAGASAVIGPRWPVPAEVDQLFFRHFYQAMRAGFPLGWAVGAARTEIKQAFPTRPDWLAYTFFGHPLCQPYAVRPSQGFTLFEVLDHPEDAPFEPGRSYRFQASYRTEAPLWYNGRLRIPQNLPHGENVTVMVAPLIGIEPDVYPLERVAGGEGYRCTLSLSIPEQVTTLPVLVRFLAGDEELRSLILNLRVMEAMKS